MPRKYEFHSKEKKLELVKRNLAGEAAYALERETGIDDHMIRDWTQLYLEKGEAGLEQKKKSGNPLTKYTTRKELTREEQLEYQIELLKRELLKRDAEVLRLKKLNARKGGDAQRK